MSSSSNAIFRVKRGLRVNLPEKAHMGELLYCIDTNQLFIGQGIGSTDPEVRLINSSYTYHQNTPSNSWVVNHNLGKYPTITTTTLGGEVFYGKITYTSINQIIVSFSKPLVGFAHIN